MIRFAMVAIRKLLGLFDPKLGNWRSFEVFAIDRHEFMARGSSVSTNTSPFVPMFTFVPGV